MEENNTGKLTITELAKMNIKRNPGRSISLVVLISVLAFTLFCGTFLVRSLNDGMDSLSHRLGADIIVVPEGYDSKIKGAILRGEPNTFYLDDKIVPRLKKVEGVELVSPQLFIATLSAGCCSFPLQLIGVDFDSDFIIQPWMRTQVKLPLTDNEIVVGANIVGNYNSEVKFFNQPFRIAGRLKSTGMGFDNTVFMTMENAKRLAIECERIMKHPVAENQDQISSVMIKIKKDYSAKQVYKNIRAAFKDEGVYPIIAQNFTKNVSNGIQNLNIYIYILITILWVLSFIVLLITFYSVFNERKAEFAMFRIIGASKKSIAMLAVKETFMISGASAVIGTGLGALIMVLFQQAIINSMQMPFLKPPLLWIIGLMLITIILISIIGPISSLKIIFKFAKEDPALSVKEN